MDLNALSISVQSAKDALRVGDFVTCIDQVRTLRAGKDSADLRLLAQVCELALDGSTANVMSGAAADPIFLRYAKTAIHGAASTGNVVAGHRLLAAIPEAFAALHQLPALFEQPVAKPVSADGGKQSPAPDALTPGPATVAAGAWNAEVLSAWNAHDALAAEYLTRVLPSRDVLAVGAIRVFLDALLEAGDLARLRRLLDVRIVKDDLLSFYEARRALASGSEESARKGLTSIAARFPEAGELLRKLPA